MSSHANPTRRGFILLCLMTIALLLAAGAHAGENKIKIKGSVKDVAQQVDGVFDELRIDKADTAVTQEFAMAVGQAESGARVTVSVNQMGEDECEVSISSESPADPEIEEKFMRLMSSR